MPNCRHGRRNVVSSVGSSARHSADALRKLSLKDSRISHYPPALRWTRAIWATVTKSERKTRTLSIRKGLLYGSVGSQGFRKACLPPSCLAGPLSRFQGSKGWVCPGSGARAACPPFVFLSLKFESATVEELAAQVYNVWKHTNRGRSICPTTNFSATPARKHSRRS
jgi:hypothetical protein